VGQRQTDPALTLLLLKQPQTVLWPKDCGTVMAGAMPVR